MANSIAGLPSSLKQKAAAFLSPVFIARRGQGARTGGRGQGDIPHSDDTCSRTGPPSARHPPRSSDFFPQPHPAANGLCLSVPPAKRLAFASFRGGRECRTRHGREIFRILTFATPPRTQQRLRVSVPPWLNSFANELEPNQGCGIIPEHPADPARSFACFGPGPLFDNLVYSQSKARCPKCPKMSLTPRVGHSARRPSKPSCPKIRRISRSGRGLQTVPPPSPWHSWPSCPAGGSKTAAHRWGVSFVASRLCVFMSKRERCAPC